MSKSPGGLTFQRVAPRVFPDRAPPKPRHRAATAAKPAWVPYKGGQTLFIGCPVKEIFAEGNRGGGKTEIVLAKYLKYVGHHGAAWRGIIFRREYKHLDDLVAKSKRLFRMLELPCRWLSSKSDYRWVWPSGEELVFRAMSDPEDYWSYHGHEYPFIAWEELTNYPDERCFEVMKSTNRCSVKGVPRFYLATGNPYGAGHGWVKARFIDPAPRNTVITDEQGNQRVCIHIDLADNTAMLENDPEYIQMLESISNDALRKAWRDGDWSIVVGGFLQGVWDKDRHEIEPFKIPTEWPRWRAMDWGFAKPYSIGWYTKDPDTGVIYRYRELYGCKGKPNVGTRESPEEVAKLVKDIEAPEIAAGAQILNNPADTNLWAATSLKIAGRELTPAEIMSEMGVRWSPARKGPGSRVAGAMVIVSMLKQDKFKVFNTCRHWLRTVPVLMPDPDNWDDVDTDMEDHAWDETRYSLVSRHTLREKPEEAKPKPKLKPGTFDWLCQYGQKDTNKRSIYRPK